MSIAVLSKLACSVKREELLRALQLCETVTPRTKSAIPILGHVKLDCEGERLRVIATDIDTSAQTVIAASTNHPGCCTVPVRDLLGAVKGADGEQVQLDFDEKSHRLGVKCGTASFSLLTLPAEYFPTEQRVDGGPTIEIEADLFRQMMKAVAFATIQEDSRFQLHGVLLAQTKKALEMVATDGHRLALASIVKHGPESKVLIPFRAIKPIDRLAGDTLHIIIGDTLAAVSDDDAIIARLIDINFPDYRNVMAKLEQKCRADRARMLAMVKRVAAFSNETSRALRCAFKPGRLTVSAENAERGAATDCMAIDYDGPEVLVGMASHYVADAVNAIGSETIEIEMTGEFDQVHFRNTDDGPIEQTHIVMPMRLAWKGEER